MAVAMILQGPMCVHTERVAIRMSVQQFAIRVPRLFVTVHTCAGLTMCLQGSTLLLRLIVLQVSLLTSWEHKRCSRGRGSSFSLFLFFFIFRHKKESRE